MLFSYDEPGRGRTSSLVHHKSHRIDTTLPSHIRHHCPMLVALPLVPCPRHTCPNMSMITRLVVHYHIQKVSPLHVLLATTEGSLGHTITHIFHLSPPSLDHTRQMTSGHTRICPQAAVFAVYTALMSGTQDS